MIKKTGKTVMLAVMLLAVIFTSGCVLNTRPGIMQEDTHSVYLEDEESAGVTLRMGAGELTVYGGSLNLMDALFVYNVKGWKPQVQYDVKDARGELKVEQPSGSWKNVNLGGMKYEWIITLGDMLPLDLEIEVGAGQGELDLRGLQLNSLQIRMGAGEVTTDLRGDWARSFEAGIKGGVGQATVLLPEEIGVKVYVKGGLGAVKTSGLTKDGDAYINDAYGSASTRLTLTIEGGVGEIVLQVDGSEDEEKSKGPNPYSTLQAEDIRDVEFFTPAERTPVSSDPALLAEMAEHIRNASYIRETSGEGAAVCGWGAFITLKTSLHSSRTLVVCRINGEGKELRIGPQGYEYLVESQELADFISNQLK